jgi:oligoendopeptidase, pepF/M3 family
MATASGSELKAPRWDLSPIFSSLSSPEFESAKARLSGLAEELLAHLACLPPVGSAALGDWLARAIELENASGSLCETLSAYAYAIFTTATGDAATMAQLNAVEALRLPLKKAETSFRDALASRKAEVESLIEGPSSDARLGPFAFHLREELFWQSRQMKGELEELAADLQRSGGDAWGRLQESVTSLASVSFAGDAGEGRKTLVELRSLAYDPDRSVREKAYCLELGLCESVKVPVAAALNGVKGFSVSLNARRGWQSSLDKSIEQARITRRTLDSLVEAMEDSLPDWRRYLKAKAALLGVGKCAFFDLFAPLPRRPGAAAPTYSFDQARDFVVEKFSSFDPAMGDFASRAFAESWIDAESRAGKVGGAYCTDFPEARAARVLCNFDGSFSSVTTIAHELGHAWHAEQVRGQPYVYTQYPMTLAETASIFAETLAFESALAAAPEGEKPAILELHLQDSCQVIVDILSRFYFERELFARRATAELSPEELCGIMLDAQRRTYGEGLDPGLLHPYMWLVKSHYYSTDLAFYNFPYAFGLLFGSGLYARYRAEGPSFAETYRGILRDTGRMSAVALTAKAGFDIESPEFWKGGLAVFARQASELEEVAARRAATS